METLSTQAIMQPRKIALPFKIEIDPMERLIVIELKNDPEYEMIEPQLFNDPVNGIGLRVILYRKDRLVDIYWQAGVKVNRATITIGAGIGHFQETSFSNSEFEITDQGINLEIRFIDAYGRQIELKITERADSKTPFPFLAPVGKDIKNPRRLFLAYMMQFDFVYKKGTCFYGAIGDRQITPGSFPLRRKRNKVFFIRYAGFPVVGTLNPPMNEVMVFRAETPGAYKVDGMLVAVGKNLELQKVQVLEDGKKIELDFPEGFPNLLDIIDGYAVKGKWIYRISDMIITGGTYLINRKNGTVDLEFDVLNEWRPVNIPFSFKVFTFIVRSFRKWPTTYLWKGRVNLVNHSLTGEWRRKNA